MISIDYNPIILMIATTFLFSALLMPFVKKLAMAIGAVSIPDERKMNKDVMPQFGGLAIFFSFLLGYILFGKVDTQMISILIGSFIVILFGIFADIKDISPKYRLIAQSFAALVVIFYGGIYVEKIAMFGVTVNFGIFAYPITLFFILGAINAINFIDGLDGLSGGIASIYFLTIGIIGAIMGSVTSLEVILSFVLLGSTLGFLYHNFYPAKIYLGDVGSTFIGFIIAVIALLGYKTATLTTLFVPLILLSIPILDTAFAIIRRIVNKKPINKPDKMHFHHQLLRKNLKVKTAVLIIYAIDIVFAVTSILITVGNNTIGKIMFGVLALGVIWLIFSTDIIIERKKEEENIFKRVLHKVTKK